MSQPGKTPPHNLEAEQSIIGGLLLDSPALNDIADIITAADFYSPAHQKIFESIVDLSLKNQPIDIITVSNSLQKSGDISAIGGTEYLIDILNRTVSSANIASYSKIVRDKSLLRKLISTARTVTERAMGQDFSDVESFVDEVETEFYKLSDSKTTEGLISAMDIVKASLEKLEELYERKSDITGLCTGFTEMDRMMAGLQPSELIIVAARPSMGKTAFSLNIAQHIALREKKSVAYFSLEMPKEAVMIRLLASEAKINMGEVRTGKLIDSSWPKLIAAAGAFSESKLFIDDSSSLSPNELRARVRRLNTQHKIDCIIVDYLQLMDLKRPIESRERAVAEISRSLKALAKEMRIPIIALAQLNRMVEGRSDRRPMLSDLRESGSIEQDADVIMLLYREDYYDREDPDKKGAAEVIIAKQRNGPTGGVKLKWDAAIGRFRDAEPEPIGDSRVVPPPPPAQIPQKPRNFAPGARN